MASSAEEQLKNKQVVRQFFEAGNRLDIEGMGQLISSTNFFFHVPGMPPMDRNAHKQFFNAFTSLFPDLRHDIVDLVAEGDKVAVRYNVTGSVASSNIIM
jgi:ketosteroid isomerase-like protein